MSSKAWPLWEVFIRSKLSHVHAGSLHATDAEMAMVNARDVYTRRMEGVSIWVIPSAAIYTLHFTDEESNEEPELIHEHPSFTTDNTKQEKEHSDQWEIFIRTKRGLSHKHIGSTQSSTPKEALQKTKELYSQTMDISTVWLAQSDQIKASQPAESEAFYDPAKDKLFRHATYYNLPDEVKHM